MQRTLTLLTADIGPHDLERLGRCLRAAGADVVCEDLGKTVQADAVLQRLTAATAPPVQALIVGLDPPRTRGWQVLEAVRGAPALAALPAIALASASVTEDLARCMALGVDYLVEPERSEECASLAERVLNAIERAQEGDGD